MSAGENQGFDVERPVRPGSWDVVARSKKVADDWAELSRSVAGECQRVFDQLQSNPVFDDGNRQLRLQGSLGEASDDGRMLPRWQIDVTSGGRIFYLVDGTPHGQGQRRRAGRVIIVAVHAGHPKETERKTAGKRRPGRH